MVEDYEILKYKPFKNVEISKILKEDAKQIINKWT